MIIISDSILYNLYITTESNENSPKGQKKKVVSTMIESNDDEK